MDQLADRSDAHGREEQSIKTDIDLDARSSGVSLIIHLRMATLGLAAFACAASFEEIEATQDPKTPRLPAEQTAEPAEQIAGKIKWNIPERLRIGPGRAYNDISTAANACALCIKHWQAIDIAKTYLDTYPIKYINIRAEYMEVVPWDGTLVQRRMGTRAEWYFGFPIGIQNYDPLHTVGSPPRKTTPDGGTWRIWYQTGWVEPQELAELVSNGDLSEDALEWGRQPLEEYVLVHALTGKIAPVEKGRSGIWYSAAYYINFRKHHRFLNAVEAAEKRSELWVVDCGTASCL